MRANKLRNLAGRIAAWMSEMKEADRRMIALRDSLDAYLPRPDEPPATYTEFLARTRGPLLHEPPASRRARHAGRRRARHIAGAA